MSKMQLKNQKDMLKKNIDKKFMQRVLELAKRGDGVVSPNPMVGAVIVKNGKILAERWHRKFGCDHAEIDAINNAQKAKKKLKGATLYVNLEPCAHFGKTPPCVSEIIKAGFSRVVVAMRDPNPLVNGKGIKMLKKAGIKVDVGCFQNEARKLNKKFIKWISTGLPFVSIKVAMSLDGKIATRANDSKWITSEESRAYVRDLRDSHDAILVGINTLLKDNPMLSGKKRNPRRIVLDSTLRINTNSRFLRNKNVLIITTDRAPKNKLDFLRKRGYPIKIFKRKISIYPLLRFLGKIGISSILVEGGSAIFGSFIDARAIDKCYFFIAPKIIGGKTAKTAVSGVGVGKLNQSLRFSYKLQKIGEDVMIEGTPALR